MAFLTCEGVVQLWDFCTESDAEGRISDFCVNVNVKGQNP